MIKSDSIPQINTKWRFIHVKLKSFKKYHSYRKIKNGNIAAFSLEPSASNHTNTEPVKNNNFFNLVRACLPLMKKIKERRKNMAERLFILCII